MAEREGFEPPIPVKVCRFSRPVPSTARPPLHAQFEAYHAKQRLTGRPRRAWLVDVGNFGWLALPWKHTRVDRFSCARNGLEVQLVTADFNQHKPLIGIQAGLHFRRGP